MKKGSSRITFSILLLSILLVCTFRTEAFGLTTPKVAIVSLDHVPFVEADNNEFFISARDYTGQVQYQLFYIQESVTTQWKLINNVDMENGWTSPVDAQTPINVDISKLNLKADNYRFAIRVKRAGVKGLNQNIYGDYDDAYPFNLGVVKNANIKLSGNLNIEKTNLTQNDNLVIDGVSDMPKDTQYKLHLFDVKNNRWLINLTEYNTNINYSLENIPGGTYIVDLWAKNINSINKYDGWKLKTITVKAVDIVGLTASEQQMLNLINEARIQNNVTPLKVDMELTNVARIKAQDMIDNNYFSHTSPKYGSPFDMMGAFGIKYVYAGENIAGNQNVQNAQNALMNSPGHRQNILSPNFTHIGLGIKKGGPYGYMFSQMFISKP